MIHRKFTEKNLLHFVDYLMYAYKERHQRDIVKILASETGMAEEAARYTITRWEQEKARLHSPPSNLTSSSL
jgi:hypothetical protein